MAIETPIANPADNRAHPFQVLVVLFFVNAALLALWSSGLATNLAAEDGILETMQLLLAAASCGVFVFAAIEDRGPIGTSAAAIGTISAIAIIREIDVRKMVVPDWMMIWADSQFRDTTVAVLLVLVMVYAIIRREHFPGWLGLALRWRSWPFWASGILLTSSLAFDGEKLIAGEPGVLVEELIEFNGFLLLLVAGWRHCHLLVRQSE